MVKSRGFFNFCNTLVVTYFSSMAKRHVKVWLSAAICGAGILCPANKPSVVLTTITYGPVGAVEQSAPKIAWQLDPGDNFINGFGMTLDGNPVPAEFNRDESELTYHPDRPLAPGPHKVEAYVTVGNSRAQRSWEINIAPTAIGNLPEAGPEQLQILGSVNAMRAELNLPALQPDPTLNYVSGRHADYLALNDKCGHEQTAGDPMFFGRTLTERLNRIGFVGGATETVTNNARRISPSVRATFDAPYHRIAFMDPYAGGFGAGYASGRIAMTFETSGRAGVVLSPAPGQSDIPINWVNHERPSPLTGTGRDDVGYPIVAHFSGFSRGAVTNVKATVTTGGRSVPILIKSPLNDDHLPRSVVIIPLDRLTPNKDYDVNLSVEKSDGSDVSRRWSFRTEPR